MQNELNTNMSKEKSEAGCFGIGFSVIFPLGGIILYFVQRKSVSNPSAYLYGALVGFIINCIIKFS